MNPYCCPCLCRWLTGLTLIVAGVATSLFLVSPGDGPAARAQGGAAGGSEWPMLGGDPSRNMANTRAKNAPTEWQVEGGLENVKWTAELGTQSYSGPVVADGKVYVGTNNARPRDPKEKGKLGLLLCFQAKDGKLLWHKAHAMPPLSVAYGGADESGLICTPTIEGDRLYYFAPDAKLICAKTADGSPVWELNLMEKYKVFPTYQSIGAPLIVGDTLFAITGNGTNEEGEVPFPEAPSFIAVDKRSGAVKWTSNLPGKNVVEGQFGSPAYAEIDGKGQVIFPAGDGWLYGLEPDTGKLIWKFHCNLKKEEEEARQRGIPGYPIATPVVYDNRVYVGIGMAPETGNSISSGHFWCVDLARAATFGPQNPGHDVSFKNDNLDPKTPENKQSALAWQYGGPLNPLPKFGRRVKFGATLSSAAGHDGLVYISEEYGYLHCLDAKTGEKYWEHDFKSAVWGSPMYADGKIYIGNDDGDVVILQAGKDKKVVNTVYMEDPVQSTPVLAEGMLFVMTKSKLFAIGGK